MGPFQDVRANSSILSLARNYVLAAAAVALATGVAVAFGSVGRETPFLFFLPVVLFAFVRWLSRNSLFLHSLGLGG